MVKSKENLVGLSPHIQLICEHWKIKELAVFEAVLRDDFTPPSDIDILVTFTEDAPWSLWDIVRLKQEF